jgi:hypothetical protein
MSILLPSLASSREAARAAVCMSNARQLAAALDLYATDELDRYAPAAANALANLDRWHGRRAGAHLPFDSQHGPLTPYFSAGSIGLGQAIRECPTFAGTLSMLRGSGAGFERGCGGYAYNREFVGTDRGAERAITTAAGTRLVSQVRTDSLGSSRARFLSPSSTIGFADGALATESPAGDVVEYSFAEPRFHPHLASPARPDPSIHFRHNPGRAPRATIAFLDAHAEPHALGFTWSSGFYTPAASTVHIGWPGDADDNSLFDYR